MAGTRDEMHLSARPALEDERVGLGDEVVVRPINHEHRCVDGGNQQFTPRQLLPHVQKFRHGRFMVEAHVVANDVGHAKGQLTEEVGIECTIDRSAEHDRTVHDAAKPCHCGVVRQTTCRSG